MQLNGNLLVANVATITTLGATGWAWMEPFGAFLQIIATIVAIVAGIYAIRHYRKKDGDSSPKD